MEGGVGELPREAQLAALETERDEADRGRDLAEREMETAKRRVKKLEGERAEWKRKIAALEAKAEQAAKLAAAIDLVYRGGLAMSDVAGRLGASEEAVKKRVQRGRRLLAECIEDQEVTP